MLTLLGGAGAAVAPALGASGGASVGAGHAHQRQTRTKVQVTRHPANPLVGRAMWIWELPAANGGDVASIIASAHRYGVGTLLIKSSDGTDLWSQFTPGLVSALHASGIRVCAWQYVYGTHPITEAYMGAAAVRAGADCLIIDAESEYEGKYISAQSYIQRLRSLVGAAFPVALAGFPYVDYHPGFPYSVFLGSGGAQYNAPQMYWRDIGVTVDSVFAHTYAYNLVYGRPIFPLGQVYSNPPAHQIIRFRQLSRIYGAGGVSWWDWQEANTSEWTALSRPAGTLPGYVPYKVMADVGQGAQGDMVVWAQEHLVSAGYPIAVSGSFGAHTLTDVQRFQTARGLTADGVIGPQTWQALLRYRPAAVVWGAGGATTHARRATAAAAAAGTGTRALVTPVPQSASLPAKRDEIAGAGGAGRSGGA
jgi:peptidoglycan hydrolase-like protein with peptidoglycan-binding domain